MLTKEQVYKAKERLDKVVHLTNCYHSRTFSSISGNEIYLKTENLQRTGSFKVRGAYNKVRELFENSGSKISVVAASAGNHAQGVAYAATSMGLKSTIVMPKGTPLAKISATSEYGAKTILEGDFYDDSFTYAVSLAKKEGAEFIHPFDDDAVIAGQATIAIEMLSQVPNLDAIIVPAGGGGLLAGVAFIIKQLNPKVKVYGVQARLSNAIARSFTEKKEISLDSVYTIADGIAVKSPGKLTMQYINKFADDVFTVTDDEIASVLINLIERSKLVVETAGAAPLALAVSNLLPLKNKKIGCVLSGGNIDVGLIHKIIEKGLVARFRQSKLSVVLKDKPGALEKFAAVMGKNSANIISVSYDRSSTELSLNETVLHIDYEAFGFEHTEKVKKALVDAGYVLL